MIDINRNESSLTDADFDALIGGLRGGDQDAWRQAIDALRPVLKEMARGRLPARIAHRADASDVVQDTLGQAARSLGQFQGTSLGEFVAWLQEILRSGASDAVRRHLVAEIRSVNREAARETVAGAEFCLEELLVANQSTASQRCCRDEDQQRLCDALSRLPERQRIAVRMKHLEGKTLREIGDVLGCSASAAAGVVARGILSIRAKLR